LPNKANVCGKNVFLWVFMDGESSAIGYESQSAADDR